MTSDGGRGIGDRLWHCGEHLSATAQIRVNRAFGNKAAQPVTCRIDKNADDKKPIEAIDFNRLFCLEHRNFQPLYFEKRTELRILHLINQKNLHRDSTLFCIINYKLRAARFSVPYGNHMIRRTYNNLIAPERSRPSVFIIIRIQNQLRILC